MQLKTKAMYQQLVGLELSRVVETARGDFIYVLQKDLAGNIHCSWYLDDKTHTPKACVHDSSTCSSVNWCKPKSDGGGEGITAPVSPGSCLECRG
ncbi:hypothetical protein AVEN_66337-1 [Araneus ventricosus]|uniref:Uncharacterized protein n=1 Tax=Araneus ventricosus TaxID=182803 RepID=A0A4Y1ZRC1_ARAVE|nr:hypothetical protein AVEN_66337-1 [Araneus ventricosus]